MLKRILAIGALAALAAAPAADAQSPSTPGNHTHRPPVRLWYRIALLGDITKAGDFASPAYTDHRSVHVNLRLSSRTAVLLYRQCTALGIDGFDPREAARLVDFNRVAADCAQTRRFMRRHGFSRGEIREARLVDDVRFAANAEGFVDAYEARTDVPQHVTTSPNTGPLEPIDCPPQTVGIVRTSATEPVGGRLETISAARDGVSTSIFFPRTLTSPAAVGSEGGPCRVRSTGAETLVPYLSTGFRGDAFGPSPAYGPTPTPSVLRVQDRAALRPVVRDTEPRCGAGADGERHVGHLGPRHAVLRAVRSRRPAAERLLSQPSISRRAIASGGGRPSAPAPGDRLGDLGAVEPARVLDLVARPRLPAGPLAR